MVAQSFKSLGSMTGISKTRVDGQTQRQYGLHLYLIYLFLDTVILVYTETQSKYSLVAASVVLFHSICKSSSIKLQKLIRSGDFL